MKPTQMPQTDHEAFDKICEQVDEFEPLPAVHSGAPQFAGPSEGDAGHSDAAADERAAPLDVLILAGLVSP